jgi:hypothetical protein
MVIVNEIIQPTVHKGGRPAGLVTYKEVLYNDNPYIIGTLTFKGKPIQFVFDKDNFDNVYGKAWHLASNAYISHGVIDNGKKKELYLHNLVMNRLEHTGKGSTESIDHKNRNGLDNRKENLRLITQTEQNLNQKRKDRKIELPPDTGIKVEDIPKHIWYIKANGSHGDRFGIDLKTENIKWKSASSKKLTLQEKLASAKEQLGKYYELYPYLNPDNGDKAKEIKELNDSYNEIIKLAEEHL